MKTGEYGMLILKEFINFINIMILAYSLKKYNFKFSKIKIAVLIILGLTIWFISKYTPYKWFFAFHVLFEFLFFMFFTMLSIKDKIGLFSLSVCAITFLDLLLERLYHFLYLKIPDSILLFNEILILLILLIILYFISRQRKKMNIFSSDNVRLNLYLSLSFLMGIVVLFFMNYAQEYSKNSFYYFLITLAFILIISNVLIPYSYICRIKENSKHKEIIFIKDKMLQQQKEYFDNMIASYTDLRTFKHDLKSYMIAINELIACKNYQKLSDLMHFFEDTITNDNLISCDDVYIGAIVNQFYHQCKKSGIEFNFTYDVSHDITMKPEHLCSICYNLISNAVEAAQTSKLKSVVVHMKNNNRTLLIRVDNTVPASFHIESMNECSTSKSDSTNHGFGLKNIKKIVTIYNGTYDYEFENGIISSTVILLSVVRVNEEI